VPMTDPRRHLPRTDAVLSDPALVRAATTLGGGTVKAAVVGQLAALRAAPPAQPPDAAQLAAEVLAALPAPGTSLRRVVNATGVVLHTNLGRAPLSAAALEAVQQAAGFVDVEFDLADGHRAPRGRGTLAALRRALPDAGDVHVVNNGAAALVLATTALAAGREVVVSRGELVEIGDGFRLPDLIASTGSRLREVGTTNRVTLDDYAAAIGPDTGCVLKVHPSNFRIEGFTRAVGVGELSTLPVPVVADVGSGLLTADPLLPDEPDVTTALRGGAAVVTFSGDKLLGGPQAGLLAGDAGVVQRLRRHPLARALRVDKLTLAALEATLTAPTPTHRFLHADTEALHSRCVALAELTGGAVVASDGVVGGGGAPGLVLPGWAVALPESFAAALRAGDPPVVGRIERGRCLLDLRCVDPAEDAVVARAVAAVSAAV
jgi:L-seryl-tRNA(Ser) seleniumtransferase